MTKNVSGSEGPVVLPL